MLKVLALIVFTVTVVSSVPARPSNDPLVVSTTGGLVRGERASCGLFCNYLSFKGIPYAKAPVGDLRFRAPQPHEGWEGIREATEHTVVCPQTGFLFGSNADDEDCLSLNVYSPNLNQKLPVMFWIYGGGFSSGSGNSFIYGPDFLVREDVVLVTINYRVGPLGFLSTGDNNAPGNYGMKDVIASLKWVQDNIANFGGDPDSVTIFGESAGGAAVHYLLLSPQAEGLFHKAISQSGSALNSWAYEISPEKVTHQLARDLNITFTDNADLVAQLREIKPSVLNAAMPAMIDYEIPRGIANALPFAPARDPENVNPEEAFLPGHPIDLMYAGKFHRVPYVTGFNDAESLFNILEDIIDPNVWNVYNANPQIMVPPSFNLSKNSRESETITEYISDFYFNRTSLSRALRYPYTQYNTDLMFAHGIDQTANIHAQIQSEPVYYYKFSFVGSLNLVKQLLLLQNYPGAVHADEIPYLFQITSVPAPLLPNNPAVRTRQLMVRMWTNFAKTGNPTPPNDSIATVPWLPVEGDQQYYEIGTNVFSASNPHGERMAFWNNMQAIARR